MWVKRRHDTDRGRKPEHATALLTRCPRPQLGSSARKTASASRASRTKTRLQIGETYDDATTTPTTTTTRDGWTASGTDRRTVRTPCACVASSQPRSRDPASAWSVRVRGNGGSTRYSAPPKKITRQKLSSSMAIVQRQLRAETPNTGNYLVNKFKMDSAQNQ